MIERTILLGVATLVTLLILLTVLFPASDGPDLDKMAHEPSQDPWFQENVVNSDVPVVVEFTAEWCGYCKMLAPHFEKLEQQYHGRLKIVPIDVDVHHDIAQHYGVSSLPLTVYFEKGNPVVGFPGYVEYDTMLSIFKEQLKKLDAAAEKPADTTPAETPPTPDSEVQKAA